MHDTDTIEAGADRAFEALDAAKLAGVCLTTRRGLTTASDSPAGMLAEATEAIDRTTAIVLAELEPLGLDGALGYAMRDRDDVGQQCPEHREPKVRADMRAMLYRVADRRREDLRAYFAALARESEAALARRAHAAAQREDQRERAAGRAGRAADVSRLARSRDDAEAAAAAARAAAPGGAQ